MDKTVARIPRHQQAVVDLAFWRERSMAERLAAVEALRQEAEPPRAQHDAEPRLQRVCRVARRAGR